VNLTHILQLSYSMSYMHLPALHGTWEWQKVAIIVLGTARVAPSNSFQPHLCQSFCLAPEIGQA
jgi:hypothetical protein